MLVGFPLGIYRVHLWLIPRNFDIGGTVGVWIINIIVGCVLGGFVVIGYIFEVVYNMIVFILERN